MTGLLHEKEFSRKGFLKGGGAMLVGFSVLGAGVGAKAAKAAGDDPFASNGPYDQTAVDSWLIIHSDNTASLKIGKVEMGQGTPTALLIIAAEELNMDFKQMKMITHDTNVTPNQGASVGSQGVQTGGKQTRAAAAAAYQALLKLASANLGVPVSSLSVKSGVVSGGGKTVTYGELIGDKLFNTSITGFNVAGNATTPARAVAGGPNVKPVSQYTMVGKTGVAQRVDIPDKVTGRYTFIHNIRLPGMLHARLVRPRGQGAYGAGTNVPILSIDESSIKNIPAQVIRSGNFLAVVAEKEYDAIQAAAQLKVKWGDMPTIRPVGNLWKGMRDDDTAGKAPARIAGSSGNFDAAFSSAAQTLQRSYKYHYTGHLPIGPSCCVADVTPNGARIFSNSQDLYTTRGLISDALKAVGKPLPANRIRLTYVEGSSVYGSAPYNDANQGAAILSALTGKPVRLQWMRWDEHGYDNYGPAQLTDIRAGIDSKGMITAFEFTGIGIPYWTTPTAGQQVGIQPVFATTGPLDTTISGTQYNIPNWRLVGKSLPLQDNYFKVSFLRAPNAPQSGFAAEQAVDELAYMAKMDPVQFRLQNIATPTSNAGQAGFDVAGRWKNVLTAAAKDANWQPKVAASQLGTGNVVSGRGVALGYYANTMSCCVADITVNKKTGKILAKTLHVAGDAGLIVYPEGSENNEEGAAIQGLSRAITEEVTFNSKHVTSLDWVTYPMLRFKDAPKVFIHGLNRTDVPDPADGPGSRTTGSGEPALAPVGAAVANAFFDATGVRIYEAPMSPARVRAVLKAAGVK
jgi:nicotinate dehydrogenase subunit B